MKKPTFTLISNFTPFVFVVPPVDLSVENSRTHKPINIIDIGEIVRDGTSNAVRISFSGFLPNINSNFYDPTLNPLSALPAIEFLKMHASQNTKFTFVIPEWGTYLKCKIESIVESYTDHTGDIYYRISLIEERTPRSSVTNTVNGLLRRG